MIEPKYFWLNIALLSLGTLSIRGSLIALSSRIKISERTKELFTFIPAAILPEFIAPAVYFHQGYVEWLAGKERLFILLLAIVVAYFIRNTLVVVAFGLIALYALTNFYSQM
jgi:branched-subunit amino acid transport protein